MNQEKIGKFIAELRKEKNMTQQELADKLEVTDRAISNWENGRRLPDYSLLENLCQILSVSINELFSGEKISNADYKKKADENLINALEDSSFSLQEKIDYFKKKWKKDNIFNLSFGMGISLVIICIGFLYNTEYIFLGSTIGLSFMFFEYNRMMIYIENNAYKQKRKNSQTKNEKVDKGFELVYWNLSYRRKFIRSLWISPICILFVYLCTNLFEEKIIGLFISVSIILIAIIQIIYTFYKWQSEEKIKKEEK